MTSRRRLIEITLCLGVGIVFRLAYFDFAVDDAFIYGRYAENLVHGHGLVFNPGERIAAITSPLFALLLAGFLALTHDLFLASKTLSLICYAVGQLAVFRLCGRLCRPAGSPFATLPAWLFALGTIPCRFGMSGMETPLYPALVLTALTAAFRRRHLAAGILAGFAVLGRPDGLALLVLLCARVLLSAKEGKLGTRLTKILGGAAIPLLPWILFSSWYYGGALQDSVQSKLGIHPWTLGTWRHLVDSYQLSFKGYAPAFFFLLPAVIGALSLLRELDLDGLLLALLALAELLAYPMLLVTLAYWYLAPGFTLVYLLAGVGIHRIVRGLNPAFLTTRLLAAFLVAYMALMNAAAAWMSHRTSTELVTGMGTIAKTILDRAGPGATVAAGDVGCLGYLSKAQIIDFGGLMQPEVIRDFPTGKVDRFVLSKRPRFIVLSTTHRTTAPFSAIALNSLFQEHYEEIMKAPVFGMEYTLFERQSASSH